MVKQKGFSLIELMIVVVIISILASIFFGTIDKLQKKEATNSLDAATENAPVEYIDNGVRTSEQVRLKEHSDGTLWACNTVTEDCYEVVKW